MKKLLSIILVVLMILVTCVPQTLAEKSTSCKALALSDFKADSYELTTDETHELLFTANILTSGGKAKAYVYDDGENVVAELNDDGVDGDKIKGDGIYSATIIPNIIESKTVTYTVKSDGLVSNTFDVNYYHMITDDELEEHELFWADAEKYETELKASGIEYDVVLQKMYEYVISSDIVDKESIVWENSYTFSFSFTFGVGGYYEEIELSPDYQNKNNASFDFNADIGSSMKDGITTSWTDPDVLVFRPYRNTPSMGDFSNEFYSGIASNICAITGGKYDDCIEQQAYPGNLKNMDQYGFFIIDSHGTTSGGSSYMIMRKGNTSNYDYAADLSARHIISSGSDVGVTGSFFTKYIKGEGKTLPETLAYLVICYGMATTGLCNPLIDCGAQLVVGYSDSVSFTYDFAISKVVWSYMIKENPNASGRTYTYNEAMALGKQQAGSVDPYGVAVMKIAGNGDFVLRGESFSPVEGVTLSQSELSLYQNNSVKLDYSIQGTNLRYTKAWTSTNPDAATVNDEGVVVSRNLGDTVIKLIVTDLSDESTPNILTAECVVHSLGELHVSGIEVENTHVELYENSTGEYINAHTVPQNATNQELIYKSLDENVVKVDERGLATPVKMGKTIITVTTVDGGFSAEVECVVKASNFGEYVNIQGSQLNIVTGGEYPFRAVTDDTGRQCVASSNQNMHSTNSEMTLDAGYLEAGSEIKFNWRVSSEVRCDTMEFYVNGFKVRGISGLTSWENYSYTISSNGNYNFKWVYLKDSKDSTYDDTAWVDDVELYCINKLYKVNFYDIDGTTVIETYEVAHNQGVTPPAAPQHTGYMFKGWSCQTAVVRSDLSVYALYEQTGEVPTEAPTVSPTTEPTESILPSEPVTTEPIDTYSLGDVNMDGSINTADAVMILKNSADIIALDAQQKELADVSKSGSVNTADAVIILKYAAGLIAEF